MKQRACHGPWRAARTNTRGSAIPPSTRSPHPGTLRPRPRRMVTGHVRVWKRAASRHGVARGHIERFRRHPAPASTCAPARTRPRAGGPPSPVPAVPRSVRSGNRPDGGSVTSGHVAPPFPRIACRGRDACAATARTRGRGSRCCFEAGPRASSPSAPGRCSSRRPSQLQRGGRDERRARAHARHAGTRRAVIRWATCRPPSSTRSRRRIRARAAVTSC